MLSAVAAVALLLVAGLALLSCRSVDWFFVKRSLRHKFPGVRWITTQELADWLADEQRRQPVLLDVRSGAEWDVSHLPGAVHVPPQSDPVEAVAQLPKNAPIVTYCAVGYRSAEAAQKLEAAGYNNVRDLEGSIFEWANEGRSLMRVGAAAKRVHPYNSSWGRLLKPEVRALLSSSPNGG